MNGIVYGVIAEKDTLNASVGLGVEYYKGKQGIQGIQGIPGRDGKTPIKGVDYTDGYTPVKGIDYFDGVDGKDGQPGKDGETPVRGVDYWTAADKAEVIAEAKPDMSDYYTNDDVDAAISSAIGKIKIPTKVSQLQNDSRFTTEAEVNQKIADAQLDGEVDLSNYYTKPETDAAISTAIGNVEIPTKVSELENDAGYLTEHQNLDNYALKSEIPDVSGFAETADLSSVATSGSYEDLSNKPTIPVVPTNVGAFTNDVGYLTEHQSLEAYALKSEIPDVSGFTTMSAVEAKGYQNATQVEAAINAAINSIVDGNEVSY